MQVPHGCRNAVWEVKSRCVVHSQVLYESGQRERVQNDEAESALEEAKRQCLQPELAARTHVSNKE